MNKTIRDKFSDTIRLRGTAPRDLIVDARSGGGECGFLFDKEQALELRDALNEYLGVSNLPLRPISFGGGGNTVVIIGEEALDSLRLKNTVDEFVKKVAKI